MSGNGAAGRAGLGLRVPWGGSSFQELVLGVPLLSLHLVRGFLHPWVPEWALSLAESPSRAEPPGSTGSDPFALSLLCPG